MTVRTVEANGVEIWCEDFGAPGDPAILLIMGAGGQAILWPDDFCRALAAGGRHVIRYDNRDTGQSTCFDFATHPYTLEDLSRDAAALLDAFGIERAHVVGASMGGMIAQTLAIEQPERVRTLVSIMSTPLGGGFTRLLDGESGLLPPPSPRVTEAMAAFAAEAPRTAEERIEAGVSIARALAGGGDPFDEAAARELQTRLTARERNPDAAMNHILAVRASKDRMEALAYIAIPTLVIHGTEDLSLPLPHGRATADAIPDSRLLEIEGMGHAIPVFARQRIVGAILEHTRD
jgi:pimeloyl-ACP methyl ester carboxylesterase